ncbi:hypothetical protein QJS10_CPB20g00645 [Acorus calamus]|uniref:Reverse transcriptase zinc-binding domain-containing protein n=1 Tax=Acorus calamus TaxID=4465 RepID=A0AAV9CB38_ACOCL|nr:hypothetical protein QJS10_CPB20g00645 [Acorus calamus]
MVERAIGWSIGGGENVHFWIDRWCREERLSELAPDIFRLAAKKEGAACDFFTREANAGTWNIELLRTRLMEEETSQYTSLLEVLGTRNLTVGADKIVGRPSSSGEYKVNMGYEWWREISGSLQPPCTRFDQIWRVKIPTKIKVSLWLLNRERLLTKVYRAKWAHNESTACLMRCSSRDSPTPLL